MSTPTAMSTLGLVPKLHKIHGLPELYKGVAGYVLNRRCQLCRMPTLWDRERK